MIKSKALISAIMFAGTVSLTTPAFADERTVEISVQDLDLARPSVQARLQDRVDRAVRTVCRSYGSRAISERADVKRCEAKAKADADRQITQRIAEYKNDRRVATRSNLKVASD